MKRLLGVVLGTWGAATSAHAEAVSSPLPAESTVEAGAAARGDDTPGSLQVGSLRLVPRIELRVRGEGRGRPLDVGDDAVPPFARGRAPWAGGVASRTRLGVDAELPMLRARIMMQDARNWGEPGVAEGSPDAQTQSSVLGGSRHASTDLFEGFVEARERTRHDRFVRVGRQVIQWGEGRLLGAQDWSPRGRSLDALRGGWAFSRALRVEAVAVVLRAPSPSGVTGGEAVAVGDSARLLGGLRAEADIHPALRVDVGVLARSTHADLDTPAFTTTNLASLHRSSRIVTPTARLFGHLEHFDYSLEGALQLGEADLPGGDSVPVAAWAAHAHVQRRFEELVWIPTLRLGASHATGDAPGSRRFTQFDPLLPNPRAYGLMDAATWSNLHEAHAALTLRPSERLAIEPVYRALALAERGGDWVGGYLQAVGSRTSPASGFLGHEVDLVARWQAHRVLELQAGVALLMLAEGGRQKLVPGGAASGDAARGMGFVQLRFALE